LTARAQFNHSTQGAVRSLDRQGRAVRSLDNQGRSRCDHLTANKAVQSLDRKAQFNHSIAKARNSITRQSDRSVELDSQGRAVRSLGRKKRRAVDRSTAKGAVQPLRQQRPYAQSTHHSTAKDAGHSLESSSITQQPKSHSRCDHSTAKKGAARSFDSKKGAVRSLVAKRARFDHSRQPRPAGNIPRRHHVVDRKARRSIDRQPKSRSRRDPLTAKGAVRSLGSSIIWQ